MDYSTLLVLALPFVLPRALRAVSEVTGRRRQARTASKDGFDPPQSRRDGRPQSTALRILAAGPPVVVASYAIFALAFRTPFDLFSTLGVIPLTTPSSKLSSLLAWHKLSETHGALLPYLTSLDSRLLYTHFGHATFLGCQQVLGGAASAKDLLAFHAAHLVRIYAFVVLALAFANARWRVWIGMAGIAGCLSELYLLGTTEIRLQANGLPTSKLAVDLPFYRHLGFVALALLVCLLPRTALPRRLTQDEAAIVGGLQSLVRQQDMLQTRIRALEALDLIDGEGGVAAGKGQEERPDGLNAQQRKELRAWLETVLGDKGEAKAPVTSNGRSDKIVQDNAASIPILKLEEQDSGLPSEQAQDLSRLVAEPQPLPIPAMQLEQRVKSRPSSILLASPQRELDHDLLSPPLSSTSSSESSSSRMDTPTPATNVPQSFDLFAAAMKLASTDAAEKRTHGKASDSSAEPPATEATASTQAGPPAAAASTKPECPEQAINSVSPSESAPVQDTASPLITVESTREAAADSASDDTLPSASDLPTLAETQDMQSNLRLPDDERQTEAVSETSSGSQPSLEIVQPNGTGGTPYVDAVQYREDMGWTTVVSRKSKQVR